MKHLSSLTIALLLATPAAAQRTAPPTPAAVDPQVAALRDAALKDDIAYDIVEGLTTEVGQRLAGTEAEARARDWYGDDRDCRPFEPSGEDFLSATLCEAALMKDVLGAEFAAWLATFLPDPFGAATACLRSLAIVSDRSDGRLAHLDGVNLSRAWCWRTIADALPDPADTRAIADAHLAEALPHLADDYMGEHWLATFALLALEAE